MKRFNNKGFSLVEIILAISLFTLVISSVVFFSIDSYRFTQTNEKRIKAALYIQETMNALTLSKHELWQNILENTDDGEKSILYQDNKYRLVDGPSTKNGITTSFTINKVFRDANGNIIDTGGIEDLHTRKIDITSRWPDLTGANVTVSNRIYVSDWQTITWQQSTNTEFSLGQLSQTLVTNNSGGEVELEKELVTDWCKPELTQAVYNLPGSGAPTLISSLPGNAYIGSSSTSSSLQGIDINHSVSPATVNVNSTFTGYATKAIFAEPNYAYLATTSNSKEVVIVNTSTNPFTEIGYFNASGTADAESVAVAGNVGYVAHGRVLSSFNLSSKTGSRAVIDTITLSSYFAYITEIEIRGNYLYATLYNDLDELVIVDISNPSNLREVATGDVNVQQAYDLFVSEDGNKVYFGTNSSSAKDFFVIDTSVKSGVRPVIGQYETNGMSVRGVTVIDNRAIIVGTGGEEYQVVDVSNPASMTRCGGLQVNTGLTGVNSVTTLDGDRYSYVIGNDTSAEFRIVQGGLGNGYGYRYLETGTFASPIHDTGSSKTAYYVIEWKSQIPQSTNLRLQLKVGNQPDLSDGVLVGPDGTGNTYFTNSLGEFINYSASKNKRYFQVVAYFNSDSELINSPVLEEFKINYQK